MGNNCASTSSTPVESIIGNKFENKLPYIDKIRFYVDNETVAIPIASYDSALAILDNTDEVISEKNLNVIIFKCPFSKDKSFYNIYGQCTIEKVVKIVVTELKLSSSCIARNQLKIKHFNIVEKKDRCNIFVKFVSK